MNQINFKPASRVCCVCEKQLYGRSDKIFCNTTCKNHYHAEVRKSHKTVSAETLKILYRNYQILIQLKGDKTNKFEINKLTLERMGFNFDTVTGVEFNNYGYKMYLYDFYWYYNKGRNIIVTKKNEQSEISPFVYRRWELHHRNTQEVLRTKI